MVRLNWLGLASERQQSRLPSRTRPSLKNPISTSHTSDGGNSRLCSQKWSQKKPLAVSGQFWISRDHLKISHPSKHSPESPVLVCNHEAVPIAAAVSQFLLSPGGLGTPTFALPKLFCTGLYRGPLPGEITNRYAASHVIRAVK